MGLVCEAVMKRHMRVSFLFVITSAYPLSKLASDCSVRRGWRPQGRTGQGSTTNAAVNSSFLYVQYTSADSEWIHRG
ncbi:hypothetical protein BDY19DRAFT_967114 [Irpex rosettiformis]|uniref:Uncharacterized protein n=1 Tax=Irpex rosettiformis TaxID=378272 RepID=A0ACB8TTK5_9APHY|nr:hypothetical protein BDY19DRAFT_967114 [Irpex rosettiformis]